MKLLIVEDEKGYRRAAEDYFQTRSDVETLFTTDYQGFRNMFVHNDFDGALVDCFFPYELGSNDIRLGRLVVKTMRDEDPNEWRIKEVLREVESSLDVDDPVIQKYLRIIGRFHCTEDGPNLFPGFIKEYGQLLGRDSCTEYFREAMPRTFDQSKYGVWFDDLYQVMMDAMEDSEDNQPLGIAVANQLSRPFVLVTSTNHHDQLTQAIEDYTSRMEWSLVDCAKGKEDNKATTQFWERAWRNLESKM